MDNETINVTNATNLQAELSATVDRFAEQCGDLDFSEAVGACMALIVQIVAQIDDPISRHGVIADIEGWLSGTMREVDREVDQATAN